ncbi:putative gp44-like protein [Esparto virus]|uniref:Putative gp44-like protein n=1 Tax=Esparto virus TaxID=2072209 RepID=A0A2I7G2X5_9VIRU|nr:putative gp44-like protein [Esparto virus]AUQ43981.1 putative gp44-like protein [Esparto virus]
MSDLMTIQEIVDICTQRVHYQNLCANNYTLVIDGTSCTKKTSILKATGRLVTKVQQNHNIQNPNTFGPSMIGYMSAGINDSLCDDPHFSDRSPMNVMDWHILWKIMDDYLTRFGNVAPDETNVEMANVLSSYRNIFRLYKNKCTTKLFSRHVNGIAIVDTDTQRCDDLRLTRNSGPTDMERSTWKFYTYLQNLMYIELYPNLYIDLNWFGHADIKIVVDGIAQFCTFVLDYLVDNIMPNTPKINEFKLPTIKHDYTFSNAQIHTYRSIGRWGCNLLTNSEDDLNLRLPTYLNVEKVMYPNGVLHDIHVAKSRKYLLMPNNLNSITNANDDNYYDVGEETDIRNSTQTKLSNINTSTNITDATINEMFAE